MPFTSTTRFLLLEAIIHPPVTSWKWKLYNPIAIKIKIIPSHLPPVNSAIWFCLSLQTHCLFLLLHFPLVADFRTHYPNHFPCLCPFCLKQSLSTEKILIPLRPNSTVSPSLGHRLGRDKSSSLPLLMISPTMISVCAPYSCHHRGQ